MNFRCRIGVHRWPRLGTTKWLDRPLLTENRLGTAMEYRACERCGLLGDVTTWADVADADLGVPMKMGPLAGARFLEIINGPRIPLPAEAIPLAALTTEAALKPPNQEVHPAAQVREQPQEDE